MNRIRLYIDEDAMDASLASALRSHEIDVVTALDGGMLERPDPDHLMFASNLGRTLYSFNLSDYFRLHTEWLSQGRHHAGLILAQQQRLSVGEQLRRLLRVVATKSSEQMRNHVEFLSRWD